jgi:hypothetical protein
MDKPGQKRLYGLSEACRLRGLHTFRVLVAAVICSFSGQHPDISWI